MKTADQVQSPNHRIKYVGDSQILSKDGWEGFIDVALWGGIEITLADALKTLAMPLNTHRCQVLRVYKEILNPAERLSLGWALHFASVVEKLNDKNWESLACLDDQILDTERQGAVFYGEILPTIGNRFTYRNALCALSQGLILQFKRFLEANSPEGLFISNNPGQWSKAFLVAERVSAALGLDAGQIPMDAFTPNLSPAASFAHETIRLYFDHLADQQLKEFEAHRAKIEQIHGAAGPIGESERPAEKNKSSLHRSKKSPPRARKVPVMRWKDA